MASSSSCDPIWPKKANASTMALAGVMAQVAEQQATHRQDHTGSTSSATVARAGPQEASLMLAA